MGCYFRISQTGWLIDRNLFLRVLEARSTYSGCQQIWRLVTAHFLVHRRLCFFPCPHMAEGVKDLFGAPFPRVLILFMRVPPSCPKHLPKASPPNISSQWVFFKIRILGGQKHSAYSRGEEIMKGEGSTDMAIWGT